MVICFVCVVTITFSGVNADDKEEKEVEDDMARKVSTGTLIFGYVLIFLASWTQATNQVLNRALKSLQTSVVIFYHGLMGDIGTIIVMLTYAQFSGKGLTIATYSGHQYLLLLLATACETFACYSATLAY